MHTPPELYPALISREAGRHLFGYSVWETENIPEHWPLLLNRVDHLLVPSLWNRDMFKNNGVHVPITVIPHIVPTVEPTPRRTWKSIDPELFVFYAIETWTARKNIDQTIRLYLQTFSAQDHSLLVIKTFPRIYRHNPLTRLSIAKSLYNQLRRLLRIPGHTTIRPDAAGWLKKLASIHPAGARVLLLTEELSEGDIRGLHQRGNCYVSLSHAEGWGLGAFDAAATGNPVIMTGYGGQADYLDDECAGVVGYDMVPARDDDNPQKFNKRQQWAEPRAQEVADLMRRIYENAPAAREKARQWQVRLREKFGQEAVMRRLLDVLENG
jgi:glycosyltransferase involved in cell wall biosynthesis